MSSGERWYVAVAGEQREPWSADEVAERIASGEIGRDAHVYADGMANWEPITGPGKVWMQSLPFSRLASRVFAAAPQALGTRRKGEGSVLGGLGDLVMGD